MRRVKERVGPHTRRANEQTIEVLIRERHRTSFDEERLMESDVDLSQHLLQQYYGKNWNQRQLLSDGVLAQTDRLKKKKVDRRPLTTLDGFYLFKRERVHGGRLAGGCRARIPVECCKKCPESPRRG